MFTVFTATMLIVRPVVGWGLDRFGRRRFYVAALIFYAASMAVFSQASGILDFYVARFLQGLGASFMWITARTIMADLTEASDRGEAMGRLTQRSVQGSMLGAFGGFTLIGMLPFANAWQFSFAGYAIAAIVGALLALRIPETKAVSATIPRLELSTDLKRLFVIFLLMGFAQALIAPIYLIFIEDRFDLPMRIVAMAFFPAGIVWAILPRHGGRWADRFGRTPLIVAGLLAGAILAIGLPWFPHIVFIAVAYTLYAVAGALASPARDALLGDSTEDASRGRAVGLAEASGSLGAALGPLAGGALYEYVRPEVAFVADGVILLVAAVLVLMWFRGR